MAWPDCRTLQPCGPPWLQHSFSGLHPHNPHPLGRRIVTQPVGPRFPQAGATGNLSIWFHSRSLSVPTPAAVSYQIHAYTVRSQNLMIMW